MASVAINQMLAAAADACDEKKAEDIRILALDPTESGLTDYFLICTGTNDRQTVAITDEIELRLKREFSTYPNSVEGRKQGEWILMDYVDFIVHVFLPDKRAYYGLERLRPSATTLSIADLNSEIKAAIKAQRAGNTPKKAADRPGNDEEALAVVAAERPAKGSSAAKKPATGKKTVKLAAKTAATSAKRAGAKASKTSAASSVKPVRRTAQPNTD